MADYVVNLTGSAQVDDSIVQEFAQQVLITNESMGNADQFVSMRRDIGAESISMPIYDRLSINTTPLNEREEVQSKALADSPVSITPQEYGDVVTKTALSSIQTGGKADLAAAQLVGINMAQTQNKLALLAADASTNVMLPNGKGAVADLASTDVMSGSLANKVYNKIARKSVPGLPQAGGLRVAIAHEDVLSEIREENGFEDLKKYEDVSSVLRNVVGVYKGFLWVEDNLSTIQADVGTDDGGTTRTVDAYHTYFLGFNGLGKATSLDPHMRLTGPFDKLARFVNVGWYGVFNYKIIQPEALYVAKTAASVGAN